MTRPHYLLRLADATSQWLNVLLLNGDANESISGRAHRAGWWNTERVIDWVFSPFEDDHCRRAHAADVARVKKFLEGKTLWATERNIF